jgi:hypothetical protein
MFGFGDNPGSGKRTRKIIRTMALGHCRRFSACGNIIGIVDYLAIKPSTTDVFFSLGLSGWRLVFFVGFLPSLLINTHSLRSPRTRCLEKKQEKASESIDKKSISDRSVDLFRNKTLRAHTHVAFAWV